MFVPRSTFGLFGLFFVASFVSFKGRKEEEVHVHVFWQPFKKAED